MPVLRGKEKEGRCHLFFSQDGPALSRIQDSFDKPWFYVVIEKSSSLSAGMGILATLWTVRALGYERSHRLWFSFGGVILSIGNELFIEHR